MKQMNLLLLIAYILFLLMFTYTVLVKMDPTPSWPEIYSICYIITFLCEKIREIVTSEPVAIRHKFSVWAWNMWNTYDAGFIIFFLVGLTLRLRTSSMDVGRVIYCVDIIYWYLRILNILGVNKYLGPLVTMMGKMVKNMIYFVVLLLVVLMSFGVARQAILYPDKEASWYLIREVEETLTPPELAVLQSIEKRLKQLNTAELELDKTLFILKWYFTYPQ